MIFKDKSTQCTGYLVWESKDAFIASLWIKTFPVPQGNLYLRNYGALRNCTPEVQSETKPTRRDKIRNELSRGWDSPYGRYLKMKQHQSSTFKFDIPNCWLRGHWYLHWISGCQLRADCLWQAWKTRLSHCGFLLLVFVTPVFSWGVEGPRKLVLVTGQAELIVDLPTSQFWDFSPTTFLGLISLLITVTFCSQIRSCETISQISFQGGTEISEQSGSCGAKKS